MTLRERFGTLEGIRLAYVGDGNNVCHSLMRIASRFGMDFAGNAARVRAERGGRWTARWRTAAGSS